MADPAQLLVLGLPKSPKPDALPSGVPEITWEMVHGALGKLQGEDQRLYCRAKYCSLEHGEDRKHAIDQLERYIWIGPVLNCAVDEDWKVGRTRKLAALVVDEALSSGVCGLCGGCGHGLESGKLTICRRCRGTGRRGFSKRFRARALDVDWKTYRLTWDGRFEHVMAVIWGWEIALRRLLRKELLGGDL